MLHANQDGLKLVGLLPEVSFLWLKSYTPMERSQIGPHQRTMTGTIELNGSSRAEGLGGPTGLLSVFVPCGFSNYFVYLFVSLNPDDAV